MQTVSASDTRPAARRHFLIDAESIVVRALQAMADDGMIERDLIRQAIEKYDLMNVNATSHRVDDSDDSVA